MRRLLLAAPLLAVLALACQSKVPVGPGAVTITETTTSTTTTTTTTSTTSTIPLPTTAVFTFTPVTPQVNQMIFFDGSDSKPQVGHTITEYVFDFGDGSDPVFGPKASHAYTISGVYLATLSVVDDTGAVFKSSQPVTVRPATP